MQSDADYLRLTIRIAAESREAGNHPFGALLVGPDGEVLLVETPDDVATLAPRSPEMLAYITQTTLSVDDTAQVVDALRDVLGREMARPNRPRPAPRSRGGQRT